jgi:hypothetical protein
MDRQAEQAIDEIVDRPAEQLYNAVMATLQESGTIGLLAVAADAKSRVPWPKVSDKTRSLFRRLAANLTAQK